MIGVNRNSVNLYIYIYAFMSNTSWKVDKYILINIIWRYRRTVSTDYVEVYDYPSCCNDWHWTQGRSIQPPLLLPCWSLGFLWGKDELHVYRAWMADSSGHVNPILYHLSDAWMIFHVFKQRLVFSKHVTSWALQILMVYCLGWWVPRWCHSQRPLLGQACLLMQRSWLDKWQGV